MNKIWKGIFVVFAVCCLSLSAMAQKGGVKKQSKPLPKIVSASQSTKAGTTIAQIITPFLLPASGPENEISWDTLNNLTNIIWDDKEPVRPKNINGISHRIGKIEMVGCGKITVTFEGSQTSVSDVEFLFAVGAIKPFGAVEFLRVLREQFGPEASIKLLIDQCPDEVEDTFKSDYKIVLIGKKPLYVFFETERDERGSDFGSSTIDITRQKPNRKCDLN